MRIFHLTQPALCCALLLLLLSGCGRAADAPPAASGGTETVLEDSAPAGDAAADPETAGSGFQAEEDSTWGDLLRYFDPDEFDALPEEIQAELDRTLLTEESPQWVLKEDGKWFFQP